ncbi:MAG TPA: malectin [Candidatus Polarisedimenticolia bacterium]|nr:malectin [Candidatus Polarisedimenticolia bacterium]
MQKNCSFASLGLILACSALIAGCANQSEKSSEPAKPAVSAAAPAPAVATPVAAVSTAPISVPTTPATAGSIIRIKAGIDTPVTDTEGNVWQPEKGFSGGDTIERDPGLQIANTTDPMLYRTEHYSMDSFSYPLPNGHYTVKLHFAETYEDITGAGQRVFSYNVQGRDFKDFDVFKTAGGANRAYIETVPVDVTNGKLQITFTTQVENPEINAIEIIPQT